tara:strand:+ start:930 stop:1097 length:168 start_codon:yes stop_codon:yes gene_type:complete
MDLNSIFQTLDSLLTITAINAVVVFSLTFAYLCIRDKFAKRKRAIARKRDMEQKK